MRRWAARISSFVSRSHSSRLNGPIAFLRVVYRNCSSVWPALRSSAALSKHPRLDLAVERPRGTPGARTACSGSRSPGGSRRSRPPGSGGTARRAASRRRAGRRPASPYERATSPSSRSTSKSSFTSATPPPGSGTPPWLVPVWTLTFEMPGAPGAPGRRARGGTRRGRRAAPRRSSSSCRPRRSRRRR